MPDSRNSIRILAASDVTAALPMPEAVAAMRRAFTLLSEGSVQLPPRTHIDAPQRGGSLLFMPAYVPALDRFGIKTVALFAGNPALGLPRIQSVMLLADGTTGRPLALMDGNSLTALRTGAASGAATQVLAPAGAEVAAIFGAGVQGRTQLEAMVAVRPLRQARIFDPDPRASEAFAREMTTRLELEVVVARTPTEALQGADIVCTATAARTPVFADGDLAAGAHINAVGAYTPETRELPSATVLRSRIFVDHRESALAEAGDLLIPLGADTAESWTELGEVFLGTSPGRGSDSEMTLFKSVGVGIQDLLAAQAVFDRACTLGLGTLAPL